MNKPVSQVCNYSLIIIHLFVQIKNTTEPLGRVPSEAGDEDALGHDHKAEDTSKQDTKQDTPRQETSNEDMLNAKGSVRTSGSSRQTPTQNHSQASTAADTKEDVRRTPSRGDEPFEKWERDEMEKLLGELRGHLVLYPTRFLEGEDVSNNFLFNADR